MATDTLRTDTTAPIVVGYDGGAECIAALRWALDRAPAGARVVVVGARAADALDALLMEDGDVLDEDVELVADERPAIDAIAATARECGASLIVVGHRRRTGASGLLHSSVAHGLLDHAGVPVVVVG